MKLRAIIVDDEPHARFRIKHLLKKHPDILSVGEGRNGLEAIDLITKEQPDIVFLDIQMPDLNGFEVIGRLKGKEASPKIIFTTAYDEYALKAFDVHASDYLLKPIEEERFDEAVTLVLESEMEDQKMWYSQDLADYYDQLKQNRSGEFSLTIEERNKVRTIFPEEIILIEAEGNYSRIVLSSKNYLYRSPISELSKQLSRYPFLRIHRKILLHTKYVKSCVYKGNNEYEFNLSNGSNYKSGRTYKTNIQRFLELNPL
ncbi:MAG: response regulator transcription factor [Balneolaceae bacterium]